MKYALTQALLPLVSLGLIALTWAVDRALSPGAKADCRKGSAAARSKPTAPRE
ncbi:hypothetical protein Deba_1710 [Desulfarculus baarsii DSM 2075]|uniref:Uncharacterized protein n=1 Tax=Desulfarculus baarsii (strain ATCC 33931 / DSM 2075 / LMG 7858 / VKM B-1802 / 2st14) TaxID=644282 RepID=E1QHN5_DESB2|nr:hypothetical protein Deba_1710 [Desulfarculus baarsii DSM 2075]